MTKESQIYKCLICGNIVKVIQSGAGTLVCCNQDMELQNKKNINNKKEQDHSSNIN